MSDKPILFQPPMVRALLDGRKSQTRRIIKPQPGDLDKPFMMDDGSWHVADSRGTHMSPLDIRFRVGDRLWVKERGAIAASGLAYQHYVGNEASMEGGPKNPCWPRSPDGTPYKPRTSMFCPRWASRLTLIVTDVRVQRLQEISAVDSISEGVECETCRAMGSSACARRGCFASIKAYEALWNEINGAGSWAANPWIVAVTFRVIKQNIDLIEESANAG